MSGSSFRMRAGLSEHEMQRAEEGKCYKVEPSEDKLGHKTNLLDLLEDDGTPVALNVPKSQLERCD
jgi:hypothetical protein